MQRDEEEPFASVCLDFFMEMNTLHAPHPNFQLCLNIWEGGRLGHLSLLPNTHSRLVKADYR